MLKRARIGPVLKFYAAVKDETPENRRIVGELLKGWMQPMVDEGRQQVHGDMEAQQHEVRASYLAQRALAWPRSLAACPAHFKVLNIKVVKQLDQVCGSAVSWARPSATRHGRCDLGAFPLAGTIITLAMPSASFCSC